MEDLLKSHKCFRCEQRFSTSGMLLLHMKESHPSFVAQTNSRIRAVSGSHSHMPDERLESRYNNAIATCPFCRQDCQTRKKLMRHLELEHKDDEMEDEPEVKVIRLDDQNKQELLKRLKSVKTESGHISEVSNIQNILNAIDVDTKGQCSGTDIKLFDIRKSSKLSKFQYRCFWCDASFRKRGKLMDHIDMFHKANKQQNEVEAELIQGTGQTKSPHEDRMTESNKFGSFTIKTAAAQIKCSTHASHSQGFNQHGNIPISEMQSAEQSETCSFKLLGSVIATSKPPKLEPQNNNICKFYLGRKYNPMLDPDYLRSSPMIPMLTQQGAKMNFRVPGLPRLMSPLSVQDLRAPLHPFLFGMRQPGLPHHSFYSHRLPFMLPGTQDLLLSPHPSLSNQRVTPHYIPNLTNMQTLQKPVAPDSPLDLTKTK